MPGTYPGAITSALFIISEDGYQGEEYIEPLTTLTDAGVDVTVATPTGGVPIVDERSVDPEEVGKEFAERVVEVHESDERLRSPKPIAQVDANECSAMVFPGGHGTAWGINQDRHAQQALLRAVTDDGSKALVVCHAVGILGFTREAGSSFLVEGRKVTDFPNEWKEGIIGSDGLMSDDRRLPYWVEDEVKAVSGVWNAELDSDTSVVVDGNLIAARDPGSSAAVTRTLLDKL